MAGSPLKVKIRAELTRRTRARWPDDDGRTALDYCADWQASGNLLKALADELECSPSFLREYLRITYGADTVRDVMSRAREDAAHVLAEQSVEIADGAGAEDVQVARLQAQTRQWVAERWNRRELGNDRNSAVVNVSIGSLMLDALRQPVAIEAPSAIVDAIDEPAEVLSLEPATSSEDAQQIPNPSTAAADQLTPGIDG